MHTLLSYQCAKSACRCVDKWTDGFSVDTTALDKGLMINIASYLPLNSHLKLCMSYKLVTVLLVMATYSGFKIPRVTLVNEGSFESSSYSYVLLSKQTTN